MAREKILQELLDSDQHRKQFSDEKWSEWTIVFTKIIGPEMLFIGVCDSQTYVSMQNLWLRSGTSDVLSALDARKAIKDFR
jgi:hypothetical protein